MEGDVPTVYIRSATILPGQVKDNGEFIGSPKQRRSRQAIEHSLQRLKSRHRDTQLREIRAIEAAIRRFRKHEGPYEGITKKRADLDSKIMEDPDLYTYVQEDPVKFCVSNPTFQKTVFPVQLDYEHRMRVSIEPWTSQQSAAQTTAATRPDVWNRILQLVTELRASLRVSDVDLQSNLSCSPSTLGKDDSETADYIIHALEETLQSQNIQRAKPMSAEEGHEPLHDVGTYSRVEEVSLAITKYREALDTSTKELFLILRNDLGLSRQIASSTHHSRDTGPARLALLTNIQGTVNPPHPNILPVSHRRWRPLKTLFSCGTCRWQHHVSKTVRDHEERCLLGENQYKCGNRDKGCKFCSSSRSYIKKHQRKGCKFDTRREQPLGQSLDTLQERDSFRGPEPEPFEVSMTP